MKGTIKLHNPVEIDGKKVSALRYDTEEITVEQFAQAEALKLKATTKKGGGTNIVMETDISMHLYVGIMAIIAVNPSYAVEDLERVKGNDVIQIAKVGRNFTNGQSEEESQESSSDDFAEPTPEHSTLPSEK